MGTMPDNLAICAQCLAHRLFSTWLLNEWRANSPYQIVRELKILFYFMKLSSFPLNSLTLSSPFQSWFIPGLSIFMVSSLKYFILFIFPNLQVTSSVHGLSFLALKELCSFVLSVPEGFVYVCLIFSTPFSWPGMKVSHLQHPIFTTQAQTDPCENSNKSA